MLSFKVVTILSMLFTLASLMPGKKYLVEIDSEELIPEDEVYYEDVLLNKSLSDQFNKSLLNKSLKKSINKSFNKS